MKSTTHDYDLNEEKAMNYCIYKKTSDGLFNSQEHIVPAFLGGMTMLPKGYVSDEVNASFSGTIEDYLSHQSNIAFIRDIKGPGKRGKKSFTSRPMVGYNNYNYSVFVSGNNQGVSVLPQIILRYQVLDFEMLFFGPGKISSEFRQGADKLLQDFREIDVSTKSHFIEDPFANEGRYLVTYYKKRWFISGKSKKSISNLRNILKWGVEANRFEKENLTIDDEIGVGKVITQKNYYARAMIKPLFNLLAHQGGREFILDKKFNTLRDFVLNGSNAELVQLNVVNGVLDDQSIRNNLGIDSESHIFVIYSDGDALYGISLLYGMVMFNLKICEGLTEDIFIIYYCDWKNRKEGLFEENFDKKSEYLLKHEEAYSECNITDVIKTKMLFGKIVPEYLVDKLLKFNEISNEKWKKIIFIYDSKKINSYSHIIIDNHVQIYVDKRLNLETFNAILEQGIEYLFLNIRTKCFVAPKNKDAIGEKEIANYLNLLSSYSIIDFHLKKKTSAIDMIYIQRFSVVTSKVLKHLNKKEPNEFEKLSLALQAAILSLYENNNKVQLYRILGDLNKDIIKTADEIIKLLCKYLDLKSFDRLELLESLISLLGIKEHIAIVNDNRSLV